MYFCRCLINVISLLVLAMGVAACIYDYDECATEVALAISNNWNQVPDASPEGMAYIFFPDNIGEPWRFDFPGVFGESVTMPPGNYKFLSFNDDTYSVRFHDNKGFYGYEAYTDDAVLNVLGDNKLSHSISLPDSSILHSERLVQCPDMMWGCAYPVFILSFNGLAYSTSLNSDEVFSDKHILIANQQQLTARYSYIIKDVENLDGVKDMCALFSGLAGSLNLATGEKSDYPVMLQAEAYTINNTHIKGDFTTFGLPSNPNADNILMLFVLLNDGRQFLYRFNVTTQVRQAPDPMNVKICIKGLVLEESEQLGDSGGFDVSVDGWTTITVNISD